MRISNDRRVLLAIMVVAAAVTFAWPHRSAGRGADSSCRTRGATLLANDRARVYTLDRGDIEVYACRYSATSIRQHAVLGFRNAQRGLSKFRLEGFFAGYLLTGRGCSSGYCEGQFIRVVDTRRPLRIRELAGSVFALRSDGVFATVQDQDTTDDNPPTVLVWDKEGRREVGRGAIGLNSLALSATHVYWDVDGAAVSASAAGPVR
jgi:hypothetical protein